MTVVSAGLDHGLDNYEYSGYSEKWLSSGCIWNVEVTCIGLPGEKEEH